MLFVIRALLKALYLKAFTCFRKTFQSASSSSYLASFIKVCGYVLPNVRQAQWNVIDNFFDLFEDILRDLFGSLKFHLHGEVALCYVPGKKVNGAQDPHSRCKYIFLSKIKFTSKKSKALSPFIKHHQEKYSSKVANGGVRGAFRGQAPRLVLSAWREKELPYASFLTTSG